MKQVYAILLIVLLVLPTWGTYLYLRSMKNQAKAESRAVLSKTEKDQEWVTLKFRKEEIATLRWEHPGEFEYQGQMYDIVETNTDGDYVIYTCYADHKETRINKAISKTLASAAGPDQDQQNKNRKLIDFFKVTFIPAKKAPISSMLPELSIQNSTLNTQHSTLNTPQPPSPPPKG